MSEDPAHEYSMEEKFYACVDIIHNMPKSGPLNPTIADKLKGYSLYKQGKESRGILQVTEGPCNIDQPAFWNLIERYKWDAWKQLGDMNRDKAMEQYVAFVLEIIDDCAENWDFDEMMRRYSDDFERMAPILRVKFRIIDRELIKEDGSKLDKHAEPVVAMADISQKPPKEEIPKEEANIVEEPPVEATPVQYRKESTNGEEGSHSRSSYSLSGSPRLSPRSKEVTNLCARIDRELRAINATLNAINAAADTRHKTFIKIIKSSAIYIAVPYNLSWRSHFFLLLWPFIVHCAMKYFGGHSAIV